MKKIFILPFLVLLVVACTEQKKSSNSLDLSAFNSTNNSILKPSIPELTTQIRDFEFVENDDGTLSIKKYNNYLPKKVVLPDFYQDKKITGILDNAFTSSGGIETIVISEFIENIASKAFMSCLTLTSFEVVENNKFFASENGLLFNFTKEELVFCPPNRENIEISSDIVKICDNAFQYYRGTNINLNEGLKEIGAYAFASTSFLKSMIIPDSVKNLGQGAFYLSNISSVKLGSGLDKIEPETFMNCNSLISLSIPGNVKIIENMAIRNNFKLTELIFEEGVITIAQGACVDNGEKILSLPSTLKTIGENAFLRNRNLKNVTIPEGVVSLGNGAFSYCEVLESLSLPSTIENIGYSLVAYDRALESIEISKDNPKFQCIDNVLYSKDGFRLLAYPGNAKLSEYSVKDSVKIIDREAFSYAIRLEKIIIPNSLESIGAYAFASSPKLNIIKFMGTTTEFKRININETINEEVISCFDLSNISVVNCEDGDVDIYDL